MKANRLQNLAVTLDKVSPYAIVGPAWTRHVQFPGSTAMVERLAALLLLFSGVFSSATSFVSPGSHRKHPCDG